MTIRNPLTLISNILPPDAHTVIRTVKEHKGVIIGGSVLLLLANTNVVTMFIMLGLVAYGITQFSK